MMYVPVQARRGSYIPSGEDAQQLQNHFHMVNGRRGSTRELNQCPDIRLNHGNDPGDEPGHNPLQRRRSLPKTPKKHQNSGHNGHQSNQTKHNQNQSSYNQQYSYDTEFESPTPSMVWDEKQQAYIPKYQIKKNHFEDQFDQYLYQSRHISTPVIKTHEAPELVLEVPSDSDSSRRPSGVSICPSDRTGHSQSPRVSQARIEIEGLVIPGAVRIQRRASHCGELQSPGSMTPLLPSLLKVPRNRSRGLP
ncbi:uncharacterized protein LOC111715316 [Eurytemora carolleeae]|uniref:uncharacterized protein LOC111715316 n=1 Tax=Eurytemora carolleeae TaxID=1294199 RepID=UPI000C792406|nr:uncharacterized protein LOC111715316 [Eurytemora carolleeae]|eukprot:XP_023346403.1 uncharacterized protein LOC111715316 [Eurytemora affinis]